MVKLSPKQAQESWKIQARTSERKLLAQAVELKKEGFFEAEIWQADPNPNLITNWDYWTAYCHGMKKRYLKKYGINQSN